MRALQSNPFWLRALRERKYQRILGAVSGVFLSVALIALFDGLIAQMRTPVNEISMQAGQTMLLSGPAALKNPLSGDLKFRFDTPNCPLIFEPDGFFSGYWFGSGMWRGRIIAPANAVPGRYVLNISFKGAAAQTAQTYVIDLFASDADERAASLSYIRWVFGLNPFIIAAFSGGLGVLFGLITYFFGRRYAAWLLRAGLVQVYRYKEADGSVWCVAPAELQPNIGACRPVLNDDGVQTGEARVASLKNGRVELKILGGRSPAAAILICLKPVHATTTARAKDEIRETPKNL